MDLVRYPKALSRAEVSELLRSEHFAWAAQHGFSPLLELEPGYCSRVYADHDRVLKVPFQGEELTSGLRAAFALSDRFGPKVYAADATSGAVLMQRIEPGTKLGESEQSVGAMDQVMLDLIASVPTLPAENWCDLKDFILPDHLIAEKLFGSMGDQRFLHGDLHHFNVLKSQDGWVPIDPKGVWGEAEFEAAAFVRNPITEYARVADPAEFAEKRIEEIASRFRWNPARIWGWTYLTVIEDLEAGSDWATVVSALESLQDRYLRYL